MDQNDLKVFDLEAKLAADTEGRFLRSLEELLTADRLAAKREIDVGLPYDDFHAATQYAEALERAGDVVGKLWRRQHAGPSQL